MNIPPGPRKQPSVSPPGQLPGQLRPLTARGPTQPVSIRQQAPDNFDGPLQHIQRYPNSTRFSQSPSNYGNLGSSPHQHQPGPHNPQQPQPPQQLLRGVAPGHPTALIIDGQGPPIHSFYQQPSGGSQGSNSQQPSSHPQTIQLQGTAAPVVYSGQGQHNFPAPQGQSHYQSPHTGGQGQQQQQQQQQSQQPQQQQQQQQGYHNQPPRFQQPGQAYHPRQASQPSEAQANHSHPPTQTPQQPQVFISQPYSQQGSVPHELGKAPLGTAVPPRGQTPPQSALSSGMYNPNAQQQPQRHSSQSYGGPRVSMAQNMGGPRPPRPMANAPMFQQFQQIMVPGQQLGGQMQMIIQQPGTNQIQVQYPSGARMPQFAVSSQQQQQQQQQQQVYQQNYYPNNQVYMPAAAQGQNQWQSQQQVRMQAQQTNAAQQQHNNYPAKREKKTIKIVDPTTGENVNLDDISTANKAGGTPPQSTTPNSRGTPVSQQAGPNPPQNASIAAQFATQVAATLSTDKNAPGQIQGMQAQPQPPSHMGPGMQQQVAPGAPPHHHMVQSQNQGAMPMGQRPPLTHQPQQGGMPQHPQGMPTRMPHTRMQTAKPGMPPQGMMPHQQQMGGQPGMMVAAIPGSPGMHPPQRAPTPPHGPASGPPPTQMTVQGMAVPQQQAPPQVQPQAQPAGQVPVVQTTTRMAPVQEAPVQPQVEQPALAKPESEAVPAVAEPVTETPTAAPIAPADSATSQTPEQASKEPSPAPEEAAAKEDQTPKTATEVPEIAGKVTAEVDAAPQAGTQPAEPALAVPPQPTPQAEQAAPQPAQSASEPAQTAPEQSLTAQQTTPSAPDPTPQPAPAAEPAPVPEVTQPSQGTGQPASVPLPQREEAKDRRKKGSKARTRELNSKGEGSDMDAFTDTKEGASNSTESPESSNNLDGAASAPPQGSTPEASTADQASVDTPTAPQADKPRATTPQEVPESTPSQEEQRRVAERNEKNSKEHSKVEESAEPTSDNKENHIEDSKLDKNETPVIKKDKMELKYKYREDQWSPLNPEGKKHYDRGFLLQLQYSSESMEKPYNLPQLPDVVLEAPIQSRNEKQFGPTHSANSMGSLDFTPSYVMQNFGGKPPLHKSNSRQKPSRGGGGGGQGGPQGEGRKVISIQIQKVELHHTDSAWKPSNKKDGDKDENEELFGKIRSILNKLTPQKFQKLVAQVIELGIDTEDKLAGTIDITFEKAISEPNFSVAYANLCKCLNNLKVPQKGNPEQHVMFRKLLLNRCQKEFERDKAEALDLEEMQRKIDEAPADKKKELQDEKFIVESKARKRSLGNIRFIGELFKLRMLTESIMHDCLMKLLRAQDEDSLEALCNLLKTIGKDLDVEKSKAKVDQYYAQLNKLVESRKHSSRLRFMILDAIDLRKNNWVPRREDNNPKTIEQIHKEAQQEEAQKKIMLQNVPHDHKGKGRGGRGSQSGSHSNQQGEDGWTNVIKPQRTPSIDPAKMKITKQNMDDTISLGRPGSFGSWGRGSSGGTKQASKESERPAAPGNRYTLLSGGGGADNMDSGRHGVGRGGSGMMSGGRDSKGGGGRLSQGRDRGKVTGRPSLEQERESALAAARNIGTRSTSGSRASGSRNSSRDNSRNRSRDNSRNRERSADKRQPKAGKELPVDEIEKKSKSLMSEYLQINDLKEALQCIRELESPQNIHMCVNAILTHVLERSQKARNMASHLLHEAIKQKVLTVDNYTQGLSEILEFADDMAIDIPQIWKYLGELIGPMIEDGVWHLSNLRKVCKALLAVNKAGILVSEILHDASHRLGHIKVGEIWRAAKMQWSDFLPQGEDQQAFLVRHKLEFTVEQEAPKSPEATTVPIDIVQKGLEGLIIEKEADNEIVFDWINANVADHRTREASFIRALMSAVCTSAIVGQAQTCKVEPERIKKRCILLQRYLDHDAKLELQALYALQALVHKLEHPPEVLRVFFDTLYDEDIISEDAFYHWESSTDSSEQAGKGVAVSSVVQFFTWLREAEEDDPEGANK